MAGATSQFNAKPAEIRQFLQGALDADRARELTDQMLAAGLPLAVITFQTVSRNVGSVPRISGRSH
jgi:hypothetical protein